MIIDNQDGVNAVEALVAWMRNQEINPDDAVPILAAAIVVAICSYSKSKKWDGEKEYQSIVLAGQSVIETYLNMKSRGKKKNEN